ncbi:uncharacterized protein C8A04DRAFT_33437 [Dichotomopilus funicola]|uniref:Uncharacterized protein n=1 Tax=Dichotomopilus funicola TaxID=1934379 RepID=A0AAN6UUD4_9PEZI|nr:hypothetical protein C8A04DRAFT_33437 [Dichotomopilus funicola]
METIGGSRTVKEDLTVVLNDVPYLLVNCHSPLSTDLNFAASQQLTPFTLYSIRHGDKITGPKLEDFRRNILEQDPTFQPEFLSHIVFYGSEDFGVELQPTALKGVSPNLELIWAGLMEQLAV